MGWDDWSKSGQVFGTGLQQIPQRDGAMLGPPVDGIYVFIALTLASLAVLTVVLAFPGGNQPDGSKLADTIEIVSMGPTPATGTVTVHADTIQITPESIAVARDGETDTVPVPDESITPVQPGTALETVLDGEPPATVYDSEGSFRQDVQDAASEPYPWRSPDSDLRVRATSYGDTHAILVG